MVLPWWRQEQHHDGGVLWMPEEFWGEKVDNYSDEEGIKAEDDDEDESFA